MGGCFWAGRGEGADDRQTARADPRPGLESQWLGEAIWEGWPCKQQEGAVSSAGLSAPEGTVRGVLQGLLGGAERA